MMKEYFADVVIIGSGPAAYTAAIYTARYGRSTIVVQGNEPGGQLVLTTEVENFPGFPPSILGPELMQKMAEQAEIYGAQLHRGMIEKVNFHSQPFQCSSHDASYHSHCIIIATGASARWLGLPSESFFRGAGVTSCATCDGPMCRNLDVAIVGGGNTAVEDALFLTKHARSVILIHRREQLRADRILQDRLFSNPKITVLWNHAVEEVLGETNPKRMTGVRVKNTQNGQTQVLDVQRLFLAIGHIPNTTPFRDCLPVDEEGYLAVEAPHTPIKGIFAAGDVCDKLYRQAISAAGEGCKAAMCVERYLQEHIPEQIAQAP